MTDVAATATSAGSSSRSRGGSGSSSGGSSSSSSNGGSSSGGGSKQRLVSEDDGGGTFLDVAAIPLSRVLGASNTWDPGKGIVVPGSTAAITAVVEWMHHTTQPKGADGAVDGADAQQAWSDAYLKRLAVTPAVYADAAKVADFLAVESLFALLIRSFGAAATGDGGITILRAMLAGMPQQLLALFSQQLGIEDEAAVQRLLHAVTAKPPEELTFEELEMCDGKYLERETECLGLTVWAAAERARRQAITDAEVVRHGLVRATVDAAAIIVIDDALGDAVRAGNLDAAQTAYAQGACPSLWWVGNIFEGTEECTMDCGNRDDIEAEVGDRKWMDSPSQACSGQDDDCESTLMEAVRSGSREMVEWLLAVGVDVNTCSQPSLCTNESANVYGGKTALHCATEQQSEAMTALLLAHGAKVTAYSPAQADSFHDVLQCDAMYPLDFLPELLVRHGASCNQLYGRFENFRKCYWANVVASGDVAQAEKLLKRYGADPNWPHTSVTENRYNIVGGMCTVLMIAIVRGNVPMIKLLLKHGANVNLPELIDAENVEDMFNDNARKFISTEAEGDHTDHSITAWDEGNGPCYNGDNWNGEVSRNIERLIELHGQAWCDECGGEWPEQKKAVPLSIAVGVGNAEIIALLQSAGATTDGNPTSTFAPMARD